MATVTRTIGASGRDYLTVELWNADLDNPAIYNPGDDAIGVLYDDADFTFTATAVLNGGSVVGLNSITLQTAPGHEHGGVVNGGVRFLRASGNDFVAWRFNPADIDVTLEDFEMDGAAGNLGGLIILDKGSGGNSTEDNVRRLILHNLNGFKCRYLYSGGNRGNITGPFIQYVSNCLLFDLIQTSPTANASEGLSLPTAGRRYYAANNTVHNITGPGGSPRDGILVRDQVSDCHNNIATDSDEFDYPVSSPTLANYSHNISSDATASGTGSLINQVAVDLFTDPAAGDFTLKDGSNAIGAGADLGTTRDIHIDITGYARQTGQGPWDMGAYARPGGVEGEGIAQGAGDVTGTPGPDYEGYPISNYTAELGHAGQCFCAFVASLGKWFASGETSDWFLFEKPAAPAIDGDPTTWPTVQSAAGGDALLDTRGAGLPQLYADGDVLHVFVTHSSSPRYKRGTLAGMPAEITWTIGGEGNGEGIGSLTGYSQDRFKGIVDGLGRPWVMTTTSTVIRTRVREAAGWQPELTIDTYPSHNDSGDMFRYVHWDGTVGIGVVYNAGSTELRFRWRADSDPIAAAWRFGWDATVSGFTLDDHTAVSAAVLSGNTGSTIFGSIKTNNGNQMRAFRCAPGLPPDANFADNIGGTRANVVIDVSNGVGRTQAQVSGGPTLRAWDFDITQPMPASAGAPQILIDDPSSGYANYNDAPKPPVNDVSGYFHRSGQGASGTWWNEAAIEGPDIGEGLVEGTGDVTGAGISPQLGQGLASGAGDVSGLGVVSADGEGRADGAGDVTADGQSPQRAAGAAAGAGNIAASAQVPETGAGVAGGLGDVFGAGISPQQSAGAATGAGNVVGTGEIAGTGGGNVVGLGTVVGTGLVPVEASGSAAGAGELAGAGFVPQQGAGVASGAGDVSGLGVVTADGEGRAIGEGSVVGSARVPQIGAGLTVGAGNVLGQGIVPTLTIPDVDAPEARLARPPYRLNSHPAYGVRIRSTD